MLSIEENQNNPLHGVSAEKMVTELVEFYGKRTAGVSTAGVSPRS